MRRHEVQYNMDEKEIIEQCRKQDTGAFKKLYDLYHQPMLRTASRMLKQQQDAEDAVQTTFLKLFNHIQDFKFQSKFSTYLFRILLNSCFDMIRKQKTKETVPLAGADPAYHPNPDLQASIQMAVEKLPHQMRACFVLFAVEEFKQKEIAGILGISIGGVKANIFHAKSRLRDMLSAADKEAQK